MTARAVGVPVVLACAAFGCVLAQPRSRMHPPSSHAAPTAVAEASPPMPSCTEAHTANAAAWPATPVIQLTPTEGWTDVPAPPVTTPSPEPSSSATPAVLEAPAGTPVAASGATPAITYAALDSKACLNELKKRGVPFAPAGATNAVDTPVRITGKIRGVDIHGFEPPAKRPTSVWEIADCRLVLALDDFAKILAKHDVIELSHMSMYRPPPKSSKSKPARHDAALAIDVGYLVKKNGEKLSVLTDWHGGIGTKTCGKGAGPSPATKPALELREILCEAAEAQMFNVVLTPNYNKPHANHFHLEVTRGVKWFIVH